MNKMSTPTSSTTQASTSRYALNPVEKQKSQLEKLLKDPQKPAYIPAPPKEKVIRPARDMMKNVQGSSAGAGSGEFHVYKASRRREYERLKLLEDSSQKELIDAEFYRKRRAADDAAEAKTAKNRAKRQKKKDRAKTKGNSQKERDGSQEAGPLEAAPIKKRRLVNGQEIIFRQPGEDSDEEDGTIGPIRPVDHEDSQGSSNAAALQTVAELPKITFIED
ncbi:hypothetical protein H0H93_010510 [Arthromyces matolae]|nr:hypothetical protein H0H93_010510 [Arthromyces matolae]